MTAKELIEILEKMPPDAVVVYQRFSDWDAMEPKDVRLVRAEDKWIALRNGAYTEVSQRWLRKNETVDWVTVVAFPGN